MTGQSHLKITCACSDVPDTRMHMDGFDVLIGVQNPCQEQLPYFHPPFRPFQSEPKSKHFGGMERVDAAPRQATYAKPADAKTSPGRMSQPPLNKTNRPCSKSPQKQRIYAALHVKRSLLPPCPRHPSPTCSPPNPPSSPRPAKRASGRLSSAHEMAVPPVSPSGSGYRDTRWPASSAVWALMSVFCFHIPPEQNPHTTNTITKNQPN